MSIQAISWALNLELQKSSEKFILVCLCNYADEDGVCYPSIATLEKNTCQDRKTIISGIKSLCEAGLLTDTGRRVGATGGVIVYRLMGIPTASSTHYVYRVVNQATGEFYIGKRSFVGDPEQDTYRGSGRWTKECLRDGVSLVREVLSIWPTSEEAIAEEQRLFRQYDNDPLCRNDGLPSKLRILSSTKNGTVPNLPASSTVFPIKQSRFSVEAVPKTVHRTIINHQSESSRNRHLAKAEPPAEFNDLKNIYPKRGGDQGWAEALRRCNAHLKRGISWVEILDGARRYAAHVRAVGNEGTQYVKSAAVFCGPDKHFLSEWPLPKNKAEILRDQNIDASRLWLEQQEQQT